MTNPLAQALRQLAPCTGESLHIQYAVVGSLALSAHGVYRATADGDLLARVGPATPGNWRPRSALIGTPMRDAIEAPSAPGGLSTSSTFPRPQGANLSGDHRISCHANEPRHPDYGLSRGGGRRVSGGFARMSSWRKLQWYRRAAKSPKSKGAILPEFQSRNPSPHFPYMESWARRLGVSHLLARASHSRRRPLIARS